jgi:hypothetical protein
MPESRDDVYSHLVARRAVARAALHLGLESVSNEALDTLAQVLIAYLERFGQTLATLVESSGRTTAHVNAMDALRTTEICISPAVAQVHTSSSVSLEEDAQAMTWKGLANFAFGPDWLAQERKVEFAGTSGKVGPSSAQADNTKGWNAPYPDEVPEFPIKLATRGTSESQISELELGDVPDEVFSTSWGVSKEDSKKRKREDDPMDIDTKRDKLSAPYVPIFCPDFPQMSASKAIVEIPSSSGPEDGTVGVRSALIRLDKDQETYWGALPPSKPEPVLAVPSGRGEVEEMAQAAIVPIGRASGSRVARVLEGSLENA